MLNHSKTLILNRSADYFSNYLADYVAIDFAPIALPPALQAVHDVLIPRNISKSAELYCATTIMQYLHCPELDRYTRTFDTRITYVPNDDLAQQYNNVATLQQHRADGSDVVARYRINLANYPTQLTYAGQHQWSFTRVGDLTVDMRQDNGPVQRTLLVLDKSGIKTVPLELLNGYFRPYFELPSGKLTGQFRFTYNAAVAAQYNVADIYRDLLKVLVRPGIRELLFDDWPQYSQDIASFNDIAINATELSLRFGALVLLYSYRVEELRRKRMS